MRLMLSRSRAAIAAAALIAAALAATGAAAHPHVFISVRNTLTFDESGRFAALRVDWTFDELYSAFAVQGLDENGDGEYSQDELAPITADSIVSLKEWGFFTETLNDAALVAYGEARDAVAEVRDGTLRLSFTLPIATPIDPHAGVVRVISYDPTYYVALDLARDAPIQLERAPAGCAAEVVRPAGAAETLADELAFADEDLARTTALKYAPRVELSCGDGGGGADLSGQGAGQGSGQGSGQRSGQGSGQGSDQRPGQGSGKIGTNAPAPGAAASSEAG